MALLCYSHLKEVVDFVKKMSFDPFRSQFVVAISITIMLLTQNFKWDNKFDIYKRWGWSEEEILTAFGKHPLCMMTSNNKIMAVMDFLCEQYGLGALYHCSAANSFFIQHGEENYTLCFSSLVSVSPKVCLRPGLRHLGHITFVMKHSCRSS